MVCGGVVWCGVVWRGVGGVGDRTAKDRHCRVEPILCRRLREVALMTLLLLLALATCAQARCYRGHFDVLRLHDI